MGVLFCTSLTSVYFQGNAPTLIHLRSAVIPMRSSIIGSEPRAGARPLAAFRRAAAYNYTIR